MPLKCSNNAQYFCLTISIRASRRRFTRLPPLSVKGNVKPFEFTWKKETDIKKRNKHTRLADKSAAAWYFVNEYLSDELVLIGSESEKQRALAKEEIVNSRG